MLLVLDNSGPFVAIPGLYELTTQRINPILPQLIRDTIPNPPQLPVTTPKEDIATAVTSSQSSQRLQTEPVTSSTEASTSAQSIPEIPLVVVHTYV